MDAAHDALVSGGRGVPDQYDLDAARGQVVAHVGPLHDRQLLHLVDEDDRSAAKPEEGGVARALQRRSEPLLDQRLLVTQPTGLRHRACRLQVGGDDAACALCCREQAIETGAIRALAAVGHDEAVNPVGFRLLRHREHAVGVEPGPRLRWLLGQLAVVVRAPEPRVGEREGELAVVAAGQLVVRSHRRRERSATQRRVLPVGVLALRVVGRVCHGQQRPWGPRAGQGHRQRTDPALLQGEGEVGGRHAQNDVRVIAPAAAERPPAATLGGLHATACRALAKQQVGPRQLKGGPVRGARDMHVHLRQGPRRNCGGGRARCALLGHDRRGQPGPGERGRRAREQHQHHGEGSTTHGQRDHPFRALTGRELLEQRGPPASCARELAVGLGH
jgi:hypothetical protein